MQRLPYDATTQEEVIQYFKTRQLQLASVGFSWDNKLYKNQDGYFIHCVEDATGKVYDAFYVMLQDRKNGASKRLVHSLGEIITIDDCRVIDFLTHLNKPHFVVKGPFDTPEYKMVEQFYGEGKAQRSQAWFMNHIDEGMIILSHWNKSSAAMAAFCLHPLTQDDDNLAKNFAMLSKEGNSYHVGLSLEYRNIANAYLSKRSVDSLEDVALSPLHEVNDMLIADKVQNYKDFLIYHLGTHPRSDILVNYFNNWLKKLHCEDAFAWYVEYSKHFSAPVEIINV